MASQLSEKKVAFVATDGVEQVELTEPWEAVEAAGGSPVLISMSEGEIQAYHGDVEPADTFTVNVQIEHASVDEYHALVLPGGTTNPDKLRLSGAVVGFVEAFVASHKPVAAICHGPWTLVESGVLEGKTLTSWPSLQTDIRNARGTWVDEEVFTCTANGWTLVTSRKPDDLGAFTSSLVEAFASA